METALLLTKPGVPGLELDLIGDLACPWSFIGKRSLDRALHNLYGAPVPLLRWHGLPFEHKARASWREHLAGRLPHGSTVENVQRELRQAGDELGINFAFDRLEWLPDTHDAHRLVRLAARSGRQGELIDALFSAYFEHGRDLSNHAVLVEIANECILEPSVQTAFADPAEARSDVDADERRMRGLGIAVVPNLLINGRVLVPGPADVATYVQALDQALFPELKVPKDKRQLH